MLLQDIKRPGKYYTFTKHRHKVAISYSCVSLGENGFYFLFFFNSYPLFFAISKQRASNI